MTLTSVLAHAVMVGLPAKCVDNHLEVNFKQCQITVEERPSYCDRGRYIVKTFPIFPMSVDSQDMFPRYYFRADCCAMEILEWGKARGLTEEKT